MWVPQSQIDGTEVSVRVGEWMLEFGNGVVRHDEQTFLSEFLMARHESADRPSSDQSKDDGSTRRPGKDDWSSHGPSVVPSVGLGGCAFLAALTAAVSVIIFRKVVQRHRLCIFFN